LTDKRGHPKPASAQMLPNETPLPKKGGFHVAPNFLKTDYTIMGKLKLVIYKAPLLLLKKYVKFGAILSFFQS
jgi:hypothetical protein